MLGQVWRATAGFLESTPAGWSGSVMAKAECLALRVGT